MRLISKVWGGHQDFICFAGWSFKILLNVAPQEIQDRSGWSLCIAWTLCTRKFNISTRFAKSSWTPSRTTDPRIGSIMLDKKVAPSKKIRQDKCRGGSPGHLQRTWPRKKIIEHWFGAGSKRMIRQARVNHQENNQLVGAVTLGCKR